MNPNAGIVRVHHTKKLGKKQFEEDPFQALAGAGSLLHIPANVTADSGNVTGIPVNVTEGSVLRVLILCRLAFPAGFLSLYWVFYQFIGPCQAAGGAPPRSCRLS